MKQTMVALTAAVLSLALTPKCDAQDTLNTGWQFGVHIRPMFLFIPNHIKSVDIEHNVIVPENKTLILFSGGLAGQVGYNRLLGRAGLNVTYPLAPDFKDRVTSIAPQRKARLGGFGGLEYRLTENLSVLGEYAQNNYNLQAQSFAGNRTLLSKNTIHQLYGGLRYKWIMAQIGPAWENAKLVGPGRNLRLDTGIIFGLGATIDVLWRRR